MKAEQQEDEFLSEHTKSMRAAMAYCNQLVQDYAATRKDGDLPSLPTININEDVAKSALTLGEQRHQALTEFWENHSTVPVIDVSDSECPSALEFRRKFHNGNIPCLLRGLDCTTSFSSVYSKWRLDASNSTGADSGSTTCINRTWFRNIVGSSTKVPVRYQASSSATVLDDDGRAEECETKDLTLGGWIDFLDQASKVNLNLAAINPSSNLHHGEYYLKDWHLQSHLRESARNPLYQVPPYFQYDLLNAFLTKFTKKGDYMFTYWGPAGSRTTLHSDVMNSFSWSFNVAGTKEWKFFPPTLDGACDDSSSTPVTVVQRSGECMFVSSGWKHEVKNLEETLSINHNWVTPANMDLTWECLCVEMMAVEPELKSWGLPDDCWDARESMLRGGCGLDVTAYFFMLMTRLLALLLSPAANDGEEDAWQLHYDLVRLKEGLGTVLTTEEICLESRLAVVMEFDKPASRAIALAEWAMASVRYKRS